MDLNDSIIVDYKYKDIKIFYGYMAVVKDNKCGILDIKGNVIIEYMYIKNQHQMINPYY